jgi:hypothetical protein
MFGLENFIESIRSMVQIGAIFSLIGVHDRKKTIAICIETGVQNT